MLPGRVGPWSMVVAVVLAAGCPGSKDAASGSADARPGDAKGEGAAAGVAEPGATDAGGAASRKAKADGEGEAAAAPSAAEGGAGEGGNRASAGQGKVGVSPPDEAKGEGVVTAPTPAVRAPSKKEVLQAANEGAKGRAAVLAPGLFVAPRRYVVAVRVFDETRPGEADVAIVVLVAKGEAESPTWALAEAPAVHHVAGLGDDEGPPPMAATLKVADYDDDGALELLLRLREDVMCPGGGPNVVTTLFLLGTGTGLPEALRTELHHSMGANPTETKAEVTHEDLDGDGHRDVRIVYTSTDPEASTVVKENRWLWSANDDRWHLTKPEYERWGCNW